MKKDYIFTPGPTPVPPEVGLAQVKMVHHRSPDFGEMLGRVIEGLKYVFQTENDVLMFASSGTGAMEAAVANCFSPGETVVVFSGGKFGERFGEISRAYGLNVIEIAYEWGDTAEPGLLEKALAENPEIKGVMLTHSETSTGVVNDVEAFGKIVAGTDALFIVDAISGLGAVEFKTDEWNIDIAISGSQKALMTPPGLAFAAVSEKAWGRVAESKLPKYYFSFEKTRKAQSKNPPQTPYTPAITVIQGLEKAIEMIREEGLENILEKHRRHALATQAGVEAMGLEFFAKDRSHSFVATSICAPGDINSGDIVKLMRNKFGVFIAGGQGKLKGKIFRLGHVGYFDDFDIIIQLSALEMALKELGYEFEIGKGVSAALKVLSS